MSYPLVQKLGLQAKRVKVDKHLEIWTDWFVEAVDLERILEQAPVYESDSPDFCWYAENRRNVSCKEPTHTARLLLIEPIVKDTAESLLREILFDRYADTLIGPKEWGEFQERARKLLGEA